MSKKVIKSLQDCYMFREYNKVLNITNNIARLIKEGDVITEDEIQDNINEIEKRYYYSSKNEVITEYKNDEIKLMYAKKDFKIPTLIPAVLVNSGTSIHCIVNASNNINIAKDGTYKIDNKVLFTLLQSGAILNIYYKKNQLIKTKASIIKHGSAIYSKMFTKVINKMFSINITPQRQDMIVFLSSLFFIINVLDRDDVGTNQNYALENCKQPNPMLLAPIVQKFGKDDFKDLDTFIKALAKNVPGLETLTTRAFTDNYITMYGATMLLSLEYLPYFLHNMFAVVTDAFINNQSVLENYQKDIDALYREYFSLV